MDIYKTKYKEIGNYFLSKRVMVTGANGFVGRNLVRSLVPICEDLILFRNKKHSDFTKQDEVDKIISHYKPDIIFHLAGLVGGIQSMLDEPAEHFYQNIQTGINVIHYAAKYKVKKVCLIGAGCAYPEHLEYLTEDRMWEGLPQKESMTYSLAKRVLEMQARAYYAQYNLNTIIPVPGNIYGAYDNFNLRSSHVVPALMRKVIEAKQNNAPLVDVWGSGNAERDFIYINDIIMGILLSVVKVNGVELINLSSGELTSVKELINTICDIVGYVGGIKYDTLKPEGQKRRLFDISKAKDLLGWSPETSLKKGLMETIDWYSQTSDEGKRL